MITVENANEEFVSVVSNYPDINCGGCLWACLLFYRFLKKHNVDTSSFEICQTGENINHNVDWIDYVINGDDDNYIIPSADFHFFWKFNGVFCDSLGIMNNIPKDLGYADYEDNDSFGEGILPLKNFGVNLIEEFCYKALTKASWNPMFYRKLYTEVAMKDFDIDMSDCLL